MIAQAEIAGPGWGGSRGMSKTTGRHLKLGQGKQGGDPGSQRGRHPADTLTSDTPPLELGGNESVLSSPTRFVGLHESTPRKQVFEVSKKLLRKQSLGHRSQCGDGFGQLPNSPDVPLSLFLLHIICQGAPPCRTIKCLSQKGHVGHHDDYSV